MRDRPRPRAASQAPRRRAPNPAPVLDEERLIAGFLAPFPKGERVVVGPGSDCAAVRVGRGQKLVSTTDAVVEGVHFDWRWFSPEQVGHKALAVNLSDLAAAGAQPRWFLCALGVPRGDADRALGVARGMAKLARRFGCALIGGNLTSAREWSITITALGESPRPLSRIGARPGDAIVVCGKLGAAAAGLRALRSGSRSLSTAQQLPEPLVGAGIRARGVAHAGIDISDGFVRDLQRLCTASGVGAAVDCDALPLGPGATLEDALSGGEDYALVLAVAAQRLSKMPGATVVGQFKRDLGVNLQRGRKRLVPERPGFDHFVE